MGEVTKFDTWAALAPQLINHPECPEWLRTIALAEVSARYTVDARPPFTLKYGTSLDRIRATDSTLKEYDKILGLPHVDAFRMGDFEFHQRIQRDRKFLEQAFHRELGQFMVCEGNRQYETVAYLWFDPITIELLHIATCRMFL
jgi:hypothetical protein